MNIEVNIPSIISGLFVVGLTVTIFGCESTGTMKGGETDGSSERLARGFADIVKAARCQRQHTDRWNFALLVVQTLLGTRR